ncbi:hypothetical protein [Propionivibrio sp.]|uniref:hypothetical protein n=1 Tax=Propionivibrio sp. TaxID=2212460 RepID=UPI003BF38FAA
MEKSQLCLFALVGFLFIGGGAQAQISVTTPGQDVRIGKDGSVNARSDGAASTSSRGNEASVTVGGISEDADVEGVTVINGRVAIDGKDVPPNVTRYKSPKSGKVYLIQRKGGSVSVSDAGDGK